MGCELITPVPQKQMRAIYLFLVADIPVRRPSSLPADRSACPRTKCCAICQLHYARKLYDRRCLADGWHTMIHAHVFHASGWMPRV